MTQWFENFAQKVSKIGSKIDFEKCDDLVTKTEPFIPFSETETIKKTSERTDNFAQQKY
jgi:hypothetical protein